MSFPRDTSPDRFMFPFVPFGQFPPQSRFLPIPPVFNQEEHEIQEALQRSLLEPKYPHDITNDHRMTNDRSYDDNDIYDKRSLLEENELLDHEVMIDDWRNDRLYDNNTHDRKIHRGTDQEKGFEIEDTYDHNSKIDKVKTRHETNEDEIILDEDSEFKKVLLLSQQESQPPSEKGNLEKDIMNEDDLLKFALSQSMVEEKLRQEEIARAEEEARAKEAALIEKQQQEQMELEKALLLSKEQEERDARQRLLEEQDQAYQESLARDKAKEEQQQQEEERLLWEQLVKDKEEDERELENAIRFSETLVHMSRKERDIRQRLADLPPEPSESDPSAVHLVFQFPSGKRIERSFRLSNTFYEVKIFVDSRSLEEFGGYNIPENYNLVTDFPRRVWDNVGVKLSDAGFRKRQLVRVEGV